MGIEEQERMLGQAVLRIREKETERRCLQRRADDLTQALGKILALHSQNKHDDEFMMLLKQLPDDHDIARVLLDLIGVEQEIESLRRTVDIDL